MDIDQDNLPKEPSESTKSKIRKEYIGYLEIKKINLKQGFLSKNSRYNHVNYNIQLLGPSNYPDKELGNTIKVPKEKVEEHIRSEAYIEKTIRFRRVCPKCGSVNVLTNDTCYLCGEKLGKE